MRVILITTPEAEREHIEGYHLNVQLMNKSHTNKCHLNLDRSQLNLNFYS